MRLAKLMLAGILAVSGSVGQAQEEAGKRAYEKTAPTAFKVKPVNPAWRFYSTNGDESETAFVATTGVEPGQNVITAWIRVYDYNKKRVVQSMEILNRRSRTYMSTNMSAFDLYTGNKLNLTGRDDSAMRPISPDTYAFALLNHIEETAKAGKK